MEHGSQLIILEDDLTKQADLRRMKTIATSLLGFSFVVFIISSIFVEQATWIGFVQATSEAAMVGALADWFAVTALFRYPLGLKIPHTAIIPNRKDEIGMALGRFVKTNFLTGDIVAEKLRSANVTQAVAGWLMATENSALIARHVAAGLATAVQVVKNDDILALIENAVTSRVRSARITPLLGKFLELITSGGRERELVQGTVKLGILLLDENKEAVLEKIGRETPWWLPKNVDLAIYKKMADSLQATLQDVDENPAHPLYQHFDALIARFVEDLQHSPQVQAKEAIWKEEILQDALVRDFSTSLWDDIKTILVERSADPDLELRQSIQRGLVSFSQAVLEDPELIAKLNQWVESGARYIIEEYGYEVEHLIAQTIERWDAKATSRKIELYVGRDLQFIRINGTIVGGLVGLVIHMISLML